MAQDEGERSCCYLCSRFVLTSGLLALFIWLGLRTSAPTCSIEEFDAFALNRTANATNPNNNKNNHTIHYDLKLNNKNKDKGIYYDALNLTFYYYKQPNMSLLLPIGSGNFSAFYQGYQKKAHRVGNITEPRRAFWESGNNGSVVFRVELRTAVRYRIVFWKTKRHRLVVGADLQVNDSGSLVKRKKNKGIKLGSKGSKISSNGCFRIWVMLVVFVLVLS